MKELTKEEFITIIKEGISKYSTFESIDKWNLKKHLTPIQAVNKYLKESTYKLSEEQQEVFDELLCDFVNDTYATKTVD